MRFDWNLPSSDLRKVYVVSFVAERGSSFGVPTVSTRFSVFPFGAGVFGIANPFESNNLFVNEVNIGIGIFSLTSSFSFSLLVGIADRLSIWKILST